MPFTTVAFLESIDAAGAFANIAAIQDQHIVTAGDDLTVPSLDQLVLAAAGVGSGGQGTARLESPSLRDIARLLIAPVNGNGDASAEPGSPPSVVDRRVNPLALAPTELLQALVHSNTTAAAIQWVIAWLADAPLTPGVAGEVLTLRGNSTTALTASAWSNLNLTWDESLPVGQYAVVGMRAVSAGLVAARLVFRGGGWRPGVLGCDTEADIDWPGFRAGGLGEFGRFQQNEMPSVDFLSISADADQDVFLDLVRVS